MVVRSECERLERVRQAVWLFRKFQHRSFHWEKTRSHDEWAIETACAAFFTEKHSGKISFSLSSL